MRCNASPICSPFCGPWWTGPRARTKFLILVKRRPEVVRGVSESLAGRVAFVDLGGFDLREVGSKEWRRLWLRGGFPRSFLAASEAASMGWRRDFIRTFLERDIPQLGVRIPSQTLRRFWMMVAHFHGQIWNGADLARSLSVSEHTVRSYVDLLTGTFMLRQLQPWFENISKRQYKAPTKVYVPATAACFTLFSGLKKTPPRTWPDTPSSVHPGKVTPWNRCWPRPERIMPITGAPTPARNWT